MSEELKPCPFCGQPFEIKRVQTGWGHWYWLHDNPNCPMYRGDAGNGYVYIGKANLHRELNQRATDAALTAARADAEAGRRYVAALIEALTAEQFCELVETGRIDGIRAWLEGRPE